MALLFSRDRLIQIQDDPRNNRPRRHVLSSLLGRVIPRKCASRSRTMAASPIPIASSTGAIAPSSSSGLGCRNVQAERRSRFAPNHPPASAQDPGGQGAGEFQRRLIVHQDQRLQRRVRSQPPRAACGGIGGVEAVSSGYGVERHRKVYMPRRYRSAPVLVFHTRLTGPSPITPSGCGGKTLGPPIVSHSNPLASRPDIADDFGVEPHAQTDARATDCTDRCRPIPDSTADDCR